MKKQGLLFILLFVAVFSGYNVYLFLQINSIFKDNLSVLALANIEALTANEDDDCPPSSKATSKVTREEQVTDQNVCVIAGVLDQDIKKKVKIVDCAFSFDGVICCDEPTGIVSEEVVSRTDVTCIHK